MVGRPKDLAKEETVRKYLEQNPNATLSQMEKALRITRRRAVAARRQYLPKEGTPDPAPPPIPVPNGSAPVPVVPGSAVLPSTGGAVPKVAPPKQETRKARVVRWEW